MERTRHPKAAPKKTVIELALVRRMAAVLEALNSDDDIDDYGVDLPRLERKLKRILEREKIRAAVAAALAERPLPCGDSLSARLRLREVA
jgi:hypothetical protein